MQDSSSHTCRYTLGWSEVKNKAAVMSESFLGGFDHPGMAKHWMPDEDCPGHKCVYASAFSILQAGKDSL